MRDADVTVANPHRYWATAMAANNASASPSGSTDVTAWPKAFSPSLATASGSGMASTTATSITQPATPDTSTERTMPRGTLWAAPTVSSEAWAEASKPVTVYAGSSRPSRNNHANEAVGGHTG